MSNQWRGYDLWRLDNPYNDYDNIDIKDKEKERNGVPNAHKQKSQPIEIVLKNKNKKAKNQKSIKQKQL